MISIMQIKCIEFAFKYFTPPPTAQAATIGPLRQPEIFLSTDEQGPACVRSTPSNVSHKWIKRWCTYRELLGGDSDMPT